MMEEVSYYADRRFLIFRLFAALLMMGLSFFVLVVSISSDPILFAPSILKDFLYPVLSVISLIGIFFFSFGFFFTLKMLVFRKPVLTIQESGIVDSSSAIDAGFISFDSIKKVYTKNFITDKYICIELIDEKEFLSKTFFLKRWTMLVNKKIGFELVLIQLFPQLSPSEIDEVAELIREHKNFYKQKRRILLKEDE